VTLRLCHLAPLLAAAGLLTALPARLAAQRSAPAAVILSPEPGERVAADQVLVAVSLPVPAAGADSAGVTVRVGLRDVTAEARVAGGVLTWKPSAPLAPGPHRVVVAHRGADGKAAPTVEWTFTVAPAARVAAAPGAAPPRPALARPRGSIVIESGGNAVSGDGAGLRRQEDFVRQLWLNAGGELRPGWRYTASAHVSGYESAFRQPVNRFRGELRTPGVRLALGDVNPVLHDVILSGRHVRGGQLELRAGPAGLSVVAGQTRRAIDGALDPLAPASVRRFGTYGQNLLAVRPSLGVGANDAFRVGLTVMRVRDDLESIPALRTLPASDSGGSVSANPAARDNLVAGFDAALRLARGRFVLRYENAVSLLARDISERPRTRAELDSIFRARGQDPLDVDPDRWDRFFIFNGSLVPFDPGEMTSTAHQLRGTARLGGHTVSAEWRSVGVDYNTLGIPGMQRDWRGLRVRDTFSLLRDALYVSAGYEQDRDNLDGSAAATTRARAGFATLSWRAPGDALLSGSLRLGSRGNGLAAGAPFALDQGTLSASAGAVVPLALFPSLRTRLSLNGSWVTRSDPANPVADTRDLYYLAGIQAETPERTADVSLLFGQNRSDFPGITDGGTTYDRVTATGRRRISERWTARLEGGLVVARSPEDAGAPGPRYTRAEALGGGEFAWTEEARVSVDAGVVTYTDRRASGRDTRELLLRVRMSQAF
jgi:hypothetical protein